MSILSLKSMCVSCIVQHIPEDQKLADTEKFQRMPEELVNSVAEGILYTRGISLSQLACIPNNTIGSANINKIIDLKKSSTTLLSTKDLLTKVMLYLPKLEKLNLSSRQDLEHIISLCNDNKIFMSNITKLNISNSRSLFPKDICNLLASMPNLVVLKLANTRVQHLNGVNLEKISVLDLSKCENLPNNEIHAIIQRTFNIKALYLVDSLIKNFRIDTQLTEKAPPFLSQLEELDVSRSQIEDFGNDNVSFKSLRVLNAYQCQSIPNTVFQKIVNVMPSLEVANLKSTKIGNIVGLDFAKAKTIDISYSHITTLAGMNFDNVTSLTVTANSVSLKELSFINFNNGLSTDEIDSIVSKGSQCGLGYSTHSTKTSTTYTFYKKAV